MINRGSDSGAGPRLLYIDDDVALARLVQKELRRHGYEVHVAHSGDEGVERLADGAYDVVALDHYMPGREGLEVLDEIRRMPSPPPVVYVTGAQEGRIAVSALKAGADDYVIKDVAEDFTSLLRSALDGSIERARLRRVRDEAERQLRDAKERAEALLREVNHRVANSLQLVASFVALQARTLDDEAAQAALRDTQIRIEAVAQVHRRLYTGQDVTSVELRDYFTGLVEELRQSLALNGDGPEIDLDVDPLRVQTDQAVSLGVIVTELVTNAVKYAYTPEKRGQIRVRLRSQGPGRGLLTVEDDGRGMSPDAPAKGSGLGRRIVAAMAASMRSAVEFDPAHKGVRAQLAFEV
jgi:two-component sensor histidine kinase